MNKNSKPFEQIPIPFQGGEITEGKIDSIIDEAVEILCNDEKLLEEYMKKMNPPAKGDDQPIDVANKVIELYIREKNDKTLIKKYLNSAIRENLKKNQAENFKKICGKCVKAYNNIKAEIIKPKKAQMEKEKKEYTDGKLRAAGGF